MIISRSVLTNSVFVIISLTFSACFNLKSEKPIATKELVKAVKYRKIKRIKDSELVTSGLEYARSIGEFLPTNQTISCQDTSDFAQILPDSLKEGVKINYWCELDTSRMHHVEAIVFQAYQSSPLEATENIQNVKLEARFLYTKPVVHADTLKAIWSIWLDHKPVIYTQYK